MSNIEIFSRRLKELREESGLSQALLAEELGVSRGSISYYENGDRTPDVEFLAKAKAYFGVDYEYLLGESSIRNHRDRTSIEAAIEHLPEGKRTSIFNFMRMLIQCAELYVETPSLDAAGLFEHLTADISTYIEAYKSIPHDLGRYDDRTVMLRFWDKTIHTNAPNIMYSISRYHLSKELQDTKTQEKAEENTHGLDQETDH